MDVDVIEKDARKWLGEGKQKHIQVVSVDKESKIVNFQNPSKDFQFYLQVTQGDQGDKLHLWSSNDKTLSKLPSIIADISSCKLQSVVDILSECEKLFETEDEEEEEEEDEEEYNDYYGQEEDFEKDKEKDDDSDVNLDEDESVFGPMNTVTSTAIKRLQRDLKNITKVGKSLGIIAKPRGDNLFNWDVKLTDVPPDSRLGKDLKEYATKYNEEAVLKLEMQFPQDYPFSPPFIRVLKPRFKFLTGHVTIGGSICMEMLTKSGWVPSNDIESILVQVKAEIMSDPNAGLDSSRPNMAYSEQEARDAFNRMVQRYNWNK